MAKDIRNLVREELKNGLDQFEPFSEKYQFYFKDYKDNLVSKEMSQAHKDMFDGGSGGEFIDTVVPAKAKAIDSSSMLAYNFFCNIDEQHPIEINGVTYYKVFFEVQLKTLPNSNYPANVDVVLLSKDSTKALFIESKFLEYLKYDSEELAKSYTDCESYYKDNEERSSLVEMARNFHNEKGRYNGIKQNICHLIGISNLRCSNKAREWFAKQYKGKGQSEILKAKEYYFMNVLFNPKNEQASDLYDKYKKDLKQFYIPEDIKNEYINEQFIMTYKKLFEILVEHNIIDTTTKDKLYQRYIQFHK